MVMVVNSLFGFPNLVDVAPANGVFTGVTPTFLNIGSWQSTAPLANLQNRFLAVKTRSVNCATDSTRFAVDLGQVQAILAVVIPRHNLTLAATMSVSLFSDAALTQQVGATQMVSVAVQASWGSLSFGSPSWFTGVMSPESAQFIPQPAMVLFSAVQFARYVLVQIQDTSNPNNYIELDRLFVTPGYQPSMGVAYADQIAVNDPTIVTRTVGGADMDDVRPKHRTFIATIQGLPQNEAFVSILMMQLRLGKRGAGQMFFSRSPGDPTEFPMTSFIATLTKLDPITSASHGLSTVAFAIEEVVA